MIPRAVRQIEMARSICYSEPWRKDRMNEQELKEVLIRENGEFRKALEDHRTCETELEESG